MRLITRAEEKRMLGVIFEQDAALRNMTGVGEGFRDTAQRQAALITRQTVLIEEQAVTISEQTARIATLEEQVRALVVATIKRIYGNA